MNHESTRRLARRDFLRIGGVGAMSLAAGGAWAGAARGKSGAPAAARAVAASTPITKHLAATDGYIDLPGRADPLYVFGFVEVPVDAEIGDVIQEVKGHAQSPAPTIVAEQERDTYIALSNLGLVVRPDLTDGHTIHWHGFRNQVAVFDGVPEVSIAVPTARTFSYFYRPHDPGTYMYHCHFEDVEHVQMGMIGNIFVRPVQNAGTGSLPPGKYVYNDGDGSTAYDREFALMLDDIDTRAHDSGETIQEFQWSTYTANYFLINGRAFPDTIKPNGDSSLPAQPLSSLVQVNPGERVLLRFANLGYLQHAMQATGIPFTVVGEDSMLLRGRDGTDLSYRANTIYIGPGESRDLLFTAPSYSSLAAGGSDANGPYNTYLLKNRSYVALTNGGKPGAGGMLTHIRVYRDLLPAQTEPNETYA